MYTYEHERPAIAVDIVVFGYHSDDKPDVKILKNKDAKDSLSLLLIRRGIEPFKNHWALPGGFIRKNETLEETAERELKEEAGIENVFLEQLYTFSHVDRDPRERIISASYFALVETSKYKPSASTDASEAQWFSMNKLPKLAFDHDEIVKTATLRLRNKVRYEPIGFELLPQKFTLTQLQSLYESILGEKMDKRNFRKKILSYGLLKELKSKIKNVSHRPSALYAFDLKKYKVLAKKGLEFEI